MGPDWVYMCRDENAKLEEATFAHTYNPKMSLSVSGYSQPTSLKTRCSQQSNSSNSDSQKQPLHPISSARSPRHDTIVEESTPKNNSSRSSNAAAELSANLAKFEQLANQSKEDINISVTSLPAEENRNDLSGASSSKRKSNVKRMTLSSIEAEPERCADLGLPREKDEIFDPRAQAIQSDSQIRWVDPKEKEERKKLAARLAHETQAIPEEDKENQQVS